RDALQTHDDDLRDAHQVIRVLFEHVDERTARQTEDRRVLDRFGRHRLVELRIALKNTSIRRHSRGSISTIQCSYNQDVHDAEQREYVIAFGTLFDQMLASLL